MQQLPAAVDTQVPVAAQGAVPGGHWQVPGGPPTQVSPLTPLIRKQSAFEQHWLLEMQLLLIGQKYEPFGQVQLPPMPEQISPVPVQSPLTQQLPVGMQMLNCVQTR